MGIWRGRTTFLGPDQHRWTVARSPTIAAAEREDIYPRELMAHQARQWCSDIRVLVLLLDVVRELHDEQGLRLSGEVAEHLLIRAFESGRLVALRGPHDPPPGRPRPPPRPFPNMPVRPARPVRDKHFLDVTIEDEEGKPLAGRVYKLTLPDASVERGTVDGSGRIYRANVAEGTAWFEILPADAPPVIAEDVPPPSAPATSPTTFTLRLVDELGQPVAGVDLAFAHGGATDTVTTDADGRATLNDPAGAPAATATFGDGSALRDAVRDRWNGPRDGDALVDSAEVAVIELHADLPPVVLAPTVEQTLSVQPYVERVRLLGRFFSRNKCFFLPGGLDGARAIVAEYAASPGAALLVVGHTDSTGSPDYNDAISLERARSLAAFLAGDSGAWLDWYGDDKPNEKRWGVAEDQAMIGAMPDAAQRSGDEAPVTWYQRTRGLGVDGVAGPQTRGRLVPEYMALEGTSLPSGVAITAHGCGQNFPADPAPDGADDPDNRRVEAFFFDGALGVQPPPPGDNSGIGSPDYPEWVRRAKRTLDVGPGSNVAPFRYGLRWNDLGPLSDQAALHIESTDGAQVVDLPGASSESRGDMRVFTFDGARPGISYYGSLVDGDLQIPLFGPAALYRIQDEDDPYDVLPLPPQDAADEEVPGDAPSSDVPSGPDPDLDQLAVAAAASDAQSTPTLALA